MGTRSRIAMRNNDGTFTSIYCHWDGYPSHHGVILRDHYTTTEKVSKLMSLGDLSTLGEEIGEKHAFESRANPTWCTFYGRDRGERDTEATVSADDLAKTNPHFNRQHFIEACGVEMPA